MMRLSALRRIGNTELADAPILRFSADLEDDTSNSTRSSASHFILCLDKSGSMQAEVSQVNSAISYIRTRLDELGKVDAGDLPTIVTFDSTAKVDPGAWTVPITASGGTDFGQVFDTISRVVTDISQRNQFITEFVILFMTDGQHQGCSDKDLQTKAKRLQIFMQQLKKVRGISTRIDALAFGKSADIKALKVYTGYGSEPGILQFADRATASTADQPHIDAALEDKLSMLFEAFSLSRNAWIESFSLMRGNRLILEEDVGDVVSATFDEQERLWVLKGEIAAGGARRMLLGFLDGANQLGDGDLLTCTIRTSLGSSGAVTSHAQSGAVEHAVVLPVVLLHLEKDGLQSDRVLEDALWYLDEYPCFSTESVLYAQKLLDQIPVLGCNMVNGKRVAVRNVDRRRSLLEIRRSIQEKLNDVHRDLASIAKEIDRSAASFRQRDLEAAAQHKLHRFSKGRRERLHNKRVARNASQIQEIEQRVLELPLMDPRTLVFPDHPELDDLCCAVSLSTFREVLTSTDPHDRLNVFGFGLNITVPEHAIESGQIVVNAVSPTILSFQTFMQALTYKIKIDGVVAGHGGFISADSAESLVPNPTSEVGFRGGGVHVNAWLPLYVNDTHLARVLGLLPLILGQFFTLDQYGYDRNQVSSLLSVLGVLKLIQNSEKAAFFASELQKICTKLLPRIRELHEQDINRASLGLGTFFDDPLARLPQWTSQMAWIVGFVQCAKIDMRGDSSFGFRIVEEIARRWVREKFRMNPHQTTDVIRKLLYPSVTLKDLDALNKETEALEVSSMHESQSQVLHSQSSEAEMWQLLFHNKWFTEESMPEEPFIGTPPRASSLPDPRTVGASPSVMKTVDYWTDVFKDYLCKVPLYAKMVRFIEDASEGGFCLDDIPYELWRAMWVQAFRFHDSHNATRASYFDTWDSPENALIRAHKYFSDQEDANWSKTVATFQNRAIAMRIALSQTLEEFLVRFWNSQNTSNPSRGGPVFDELRDILLNSSVDVPIRYDKVAVVVTGRIADPLRADAYGLPVLASGFSWIMNETLRIAIRAVLTAEEQDALRTQVRHFASEYESSCHRYRESGILTRHLSSNAHPHRHDRTQSEVVSLARLYVDQHGTNPLKYRHLLAP
eukprot:ANDGO_03081.mRNA.1 hypothetical protein CAOG_05669